MTIHSIRQSPYSFFICISILFVFIALSSSPTAEASTGCQHYKGGSNCPAEAPCCQSGWCSNAQSFCSLALGCQPENSFSPNTCLPLPLCTSFTEVQIQIDKTGPVWRRKSLTLFLFKDNQPSLTHTFHGSNSL